MANNTWIRLYDTIVYKPGESLTPKSIGGNNGDTIPKQYKNFSWQELAQQKRVILAGMRVSYHIQFAQVSSEPLKSRQMYFENFSNFEFTIKETSFGTLGLSTVLPYKLNYILSDVDAVKDTYPIFAFQEEMVLPESGAIKVEFNPAQGVTAGASADTNPQLPGLGLSNDRGFFIFVEFFGVQERETI